jgi:translation initiation factor 2B subunit (eIF-2B alpha/beta/delta family)
LDRVWLGERFYHHLKSIYDDRRHGASELATLSLVALQDWLTDEEKICSYAKSEERLKQRLMNGKYLLQTARPSMAPVFIQTFHRLSSKLEQSAEWQSNDPKICLHAAMSAIHEVIEWRNSLTDRMVQHALHHFHEHRHLVLFTMSKSSTVHRILTGLSRQCEQLTVVVSESRPLNEGTDFALSLARDGVHVYLTTEAQIANTMQRWKEDSNATCSILLGCDRVLVHDAGEMQIVNKTGTSVLLLAARAWSIPVVIVGESGKFVYDQPSNPWDDEGASYNVTMEEEEQGRWQDLIPIEKQEEFRKSGINVLNAVFERVPCSWLPRDSCFITESKVEKAQRTE